ncbi:TRAP transporter small permease subunit [Lentibacter sp. XHP0401]|jgi:TRAP-type mannitol/chloroaromatic compound transport system permease small subunit|uniref:TRAP transporter small permease subunit n=1 Tax=Lentibacter sp. XHP0401 TaxID=2984334 RepID=UPI0021E8894A|nr:TRAP transporter small permease subunit [Lentibacter sp. XHP0401]MCV2892803.1 TRAP transporter small permease subunit [Lentibacter sp. XHP0401]
MRSGFLSVCHWLDRITTWICATACVVLAGAVLGTVILRFGFDTGFVRLQNLAGYAFAVSMILSLPFCLRRGGHVRVEVLSERMPAGYVRAVDMAALVLFLIPVFGLMVWAWLPDLAYSWKILEGAIETGGLGGVFLVKTMLPFAGVLMILQGIAVLLDPRLVTQ